MTLLNRLFGDSEYLAKEIELDDEQILNIWKQYLATIDEKKRLASNIIQNSAALRKLLDIELIDVSQEQEKESELEADLRKLVHSNKIQRVHKLEQCLGYAETKYEYVHELLRELHKILKEEARLLEKSPENLSSLFVLRLQVEQEIINKIDDIKTFPRLFSALVKGEHIIKTMDAKEKRLFKRMTVEFEKGITYDLTVAIFNGVEAKVHEAIANGVLEGYHHDVDFEFVNRPEFIELVKENIKRLRKREFTPQMLSVFVHLFREWYNHGRD